jgi:hypothetical protein
VDSWNGINSQFDTPALQFLTDPVSILSFKPSKYSVTELIIFTIYKHRFLFSEAKSLDALEKQGYKVWYDSACYGIL